jgi:DNA-binding NarL/FixJ family response regulator
LAGLSWIQVGEQVSELEHAPDASSTRVVIADDHPLFRAGVRERLEKHASGIEVVGEAADGEEAYELVGRLNPDVVLLDIAMPNVNGIEATGKITSSRQEP